MPAPAETWGQKWSLPFGKRRASAKKIEIESTSTNDEEPTKLHDILSAIRIELKQNYSRPAPSTEPRGDVFITLPHIQQVITRARLRTILSHCFWYNETSIDFDEVYKKCLRVIATLISIDWTAWTDFKRLFLDVRDQSGPRRSDRFLPFKTDDLEFLEPANFRALFEDEQFVFCPLIIREDHDEICDARVRLPFTASLASRDGGFGRVIKQEIEKYQIHYRSAHSKVETFPNSERRVMALKIISGSVPGGSQTFRKERQILQTFKSASLKCEGISMNFSTFVHGKTLNIIAPWADLDLFDFIRGKYSDFSKKALDFTPWHLFEQTRCLAQALHFLHNELDIEGPVSCIHLDLKLENVLVEWQTGESNEGQSSNRRERPVGLWKLNDFGISVLRNEDSMNRGKAAHQLAPGDVTEMYRESSSVPAPRGPGAFLPPETKFSKASDMWSLGCILAMVLAFVVGGPEATGELYMRRKSGYENDHFYWKESVEPPAIENEPAIKEEVIAWFEEQLQSTTLPELRECISHCRDLVFRLIQIQKDLRPKATEARDAIQDIRNHSKGLKLQWSPKPGNPYLKLAEQQYPTPNPTPHFSSPFIDINIPLQTHEEIPRSPDFPISPLTRKLSMAPSSALLKLETPKEIVSGGTCLSTCGTRVAFVGKAQAYVYDLNKSGILYQKLKLGTNHKDAVKQSEVKLESWVFPCSSGRGWTSAVLAGSYVALVSESLNGSGNDACVHLYNTKRYATASGSRILEILIKPLAENYNKVILSTEGCLAVVNDEDLTIYSTGHEGSLSMQELITADFSTDGEWLCVWRKITNSPKRHRWVIYHATSMPPKLVAGQTVNVPDRQQKSTSLLPMLVPFARGGRFAAIDEYGNLWLISKDGPDKPEASLVKLDGSVVGAALPSDDAFLLLRRLHGVSKLQMNLIEVTQRRGGKSLDVRNWPQLDGESEDGPPGLAAIFDEQGVAIITSHANGSVYHKIADDATTS